MPILCPSCGTQVELLTDTASDSQLCPNCGSNISASLQSTMDAKPLTIVRQIGKYELLKTVGSGAFGAVYQARDTALDRIVAVKVPRLGSVTSRDDIERFSREGRAAAQLRHPGIVAIYDAGVCDDGSAGEIQVPFIVSEFVQGVTLSDVLSSRQPDFHESAELVACIADALDYAHRHGVFHRDVKPANIMMECLDYETRCTSGNVTVATGVASRSRLTARVRLMDFGLAKRDAGDISLTLDGQILGTPAYMSPEQAGGRSHEVSGTTDIYSLGVILYQLLTGQLPFQGTSRMVLHQVLHEDARPPRLINPGIPRDLQTICLRAIEKDPSRRYHTAIDMADDLRRFLNSEPIKARRIGNLEMALRWVRRNPALASSALGVFCGLLAIGLSLPNRNDGAFPNGMYLRPTILFLLDAGGVAVMLIASLGVGLTASVAANLAFSNRRQIFVTHAVLSLLPIILALTGLLRVYSRYIELSVSADAPRLYEFAALMSNGLAWAIVGSTSSIAPLVLSLIGVALKGPKSLDSSA